MPRTRLVWHLFVVWCLLVAAVLAGSFWLGSVQIGTLATEAERQRLEELGRRLATSLAAGAGDDATRDERLRQFAATTGLEVELLGPTGALLAAAPSRPQSPGRTGPLPRPTTSGRAASGSRYDVGTGSRILAVVVPHGPPGSPSFVVRLTTDTSVSDAAVGRSVKRLAAGSLACGGLAIGLAWLLARRAAQPVEALCDAATRLVSHPDVAAVTFTGGTAAGDALARAAGARKFVAELGSNAANVVLADADLADAATRIASAAFEASGQQCVSAQRIIVDAAVLDRFVDCFVAAASALRVGDPYDPATDVGPMVSAEAAERVMRMATESVAAGGRFALAPTRQGCLVSPGILVGSPKTASIWQAEAFGPLAVVVPAADPQEALDLANDSPFGLQGSLFTRDLAWAFRFARDFDVGALWINEASRFRLDMYPFGGVKQSGNGREGIRYAIEELSQLKFVGLRFDL
jgi:hypothetical protein